MDAYDDRDRLEGASGIIPPQRAQMAPAETTAETVLSAVLGNLYIGMLAADDDRNIRKINSRPPDIFEVSEFVDNFVERNRVEAAKALGSLFTEPHFVYNSTESDFQIIKGRDK
jgi:hypothetical protein